MKPTAEEVIRAIKEYDGIFNSLPGLDKSTGFLAVVEEYITLSTHIEHLSQLSPDEYNQVSTIEAGKLSYPAWPDDPQTWLDIEVNSARLNPGRVFDNAQSLTHSLVWHIHRLRLRVVRSLRCSELSGASPELERKRLHKEFSEKKKALIAYLREAADIFDSGQCDPGLYPALTKYDEDRWCGSERLREWARHVEMSPVEVVFPVVRPRHGLVLPFKNAGKSGRASDPDAALRAMVVREIADRVPDGIKIPNSDRQRYSVIAELMRYTGITVTSAYVRSLILRGKT
jgi:hypothetical protein